MVSPECLQVVLIKNKAVQCKGMQQFMCVKD